MRPNNTCSALFTTLDAGRRNSFVRSDATTGAERPRAKVRAARLVATSVAALILLAAGSAHADFFVERCGSEEVKALTHKKACKKKPGQVVVKCKRVCVDRKGVRCRKREWRESAARQCAGTAAGKEKLAVKLCRPLCGRIKKRRPFPEWEANKVRNTRQRKTFFGTIWAPPRRDVRRIAIFSAGQQTVAGLGDHANLIASSFEGYRKRFGNRDCCKEVALDRRGLAGRFVTSQPRGSRWNENNTLVVSVHDLQFNHIFSKRAKRRVLASFYDWLSARVDWNNIDYVYLAGSSRGGCFSMRFGDHIMRKAATPQRTRFILQSVDGVCNKGQGEFGTSGSKIDNPLRRKAKYKLYPTDVRAQFPSGRLGNICAFQIAGGEEVTKLGLGVHAFSEQSARGRTGETTLVEGGHTFYRQQWSTFRHPELGRDGSLNPNTVDLLWSRLQDCMRGWGSPVPGPAWRAR